MRRATLPTDGLFFFDRRFLSTLSLRRATWPGRLARPFFIISIHALLAESDLRHCTTYLNCSHFYPRSPCGERQYINSRTDNVKRFLSTLSLRRATPDGPAKLPKQINFYPRSPCGERPLTPARISSRLLISIHALLAESDVGLSYFYIIKITISIHALLAESDLII